VDAKNEHAKHHEQCDETAQAPEVDARGRDIADTAVGRPVVGVAVVGARAGGGGDPGGPEEEPRHLQAFFGSGDRIRKEAVIGLAPAEGVFPHLCNLRQRLSLWRREHQHIVFRVVAVGADFLSQLEVDDFLFEAPQGHVVLAVVLSGKVIADAVTHEVQGVGREFRTALGTMTPNAAVIHESVPLVDILALHDVRFNEKQVPPLIHDLPRIGRQVIFGEISTADEEQG